MSFLERPAPIAIIFGSFAFVFLPLALLSLIPNFYPYLPQLILLEAIGLGTSHFFITLAVYLHAENRDYFASTPRNKLIFFAAPCAIFGFFALSAATSWRDAYPIFSAYLFAGLRFFDFFHVGRQSVGMLQLWKRAAHAELSAWLRGAENAFFVGLALLQWLTFALGGHFDPDRPYLVLPALALATLFFVILFAYARARIHGQKRLGRPSAYFVLQAICAASAAYQTRLYLIALALHYTEYHVVMQPRCFHGKLDPSRAIDRFARALRSRPAFFYGVLAAIVIAFELRSYAPPGMSSSTRFFVHLFDGIFFVHYLIEAFLWKFGDPFYRATLAPLYFGASPPDREPRPRPRALWPALLVLALLALAFAALPSGRLGATLARIEQRMVDPMLVDQHLRWGVQLAERGELESARRHLQKALAHGAGDPRTKQALDWVDRRLASRQK